MISSSVISFSFQLQSYPALGSFPMSQFFTSDDQTIGASASASVLPMNIQDWFPLGQTGLISLQPKGLSKVFSNITFQKHQFFSSQLSLWSNSHIHTWLIGKTIGLNRQTFVGKAKSLLFNMLSRLVPEWSSDFPYFLQFKSEFGNKESWSEPQSAPSLVFVDYIELLHL